jgi:hypothetical protein
MAHSFTKIKTHSTHLSDEFWYLEAQTRISDLVDPEDMSPSTLEWIYKDARRTYPILPENPEYTYRANWQSWAVFFGVLQYTPTTQGVRPDGVYLTLTWFQKILSIKNIRSATAYKEARFWLILEYQKKLWYKYKLFPAEPHIFYAAAGTTARAFFGNTLTPLYSWDEFKVVIKNLGIKKQESYWLECERDKRLPINPWRHYSDQWTSWAEVFGTWVAKIHIERVAMSVAQALIQTNMLDTIPKYTTFVKSHPELNLPSRPHQTYRLTKYGSSWEGGEFADFLKAAIAKVPESVYPDCA